MAIAGPLALPTWNTIMQKILAAAVSLLALNASAQVQITGRGDIQAEAQALGCTNEMLALRSSDLMKLGQVASPLFRGLTQQGFDYSGTTDGAFHKLVKEPHSNLMAAAQRKDLDEAWVGYHQLVMRSRSMKETQPESAKWRDFESKATAYHLCAIKSRFKIDIAQEQRDAKQGAATGRDALKAEAATKEQTGSLHYACNMHEFPESFDSAQTHYVYRPDGTGKMTSSGLPIMNPAGTSCRSATFSWTNAGKTFRERGNNDVPLAGFQRRMKFDSEERDHRRCYSGHRTSLKEAVLIPSETLTPGQVQVREYMVSQMRDSAPELASRSDGATNRYGLSCLVRTE